MQARSHTETHQDNENTSTSTESCRGKRANNRFNNEIKVQKLTRQPIIGKPNPDQVFKSDSQGHNESHIRDALVRVRLIGDSTFEMLKHSNSSERRNAHGTFSLVVVDGDNEYSCKVLNIERILPLGIKGGQFLNISYYWSCGEPVIVRIQDAVNGNKIYES
jgi:hypothetical protein